jgi:hypothetical protein
VLGGGHTSLALPTERVAALLRIDQDRPSGEAVAVDILEVWRAIYPLKSRNNIFCTAQLMTLFFFCYARRAHAYGKPSQQIEKNYGCCHYKMLRRR